MSSLKNFPFKKISSYVLLILFYKCALHSSLYLYYILLTILSNLLCTLIYLVKMEIFKSNSNCLLIKILEIVKVSYIFQKNERNLRTVKVSAFKNFEKRFSLKNVRLTEKTYNPTTLLADLCKSQVLVKDVRDNLGIKKTSSFRCFKYFQPN